MRATSLVALGLAVVSWVGLSRAERPRIELSVHGGYAREIDPSVRGDLGPYRYGLGARAGVLFDRLFVGAWFTQHIGTTQTASGPGSSYDAHYDAMLLGPELGYELRFGEYVVVRPSLGGGLHRLAGHTSVQGITIDDASSRLYLSAAVLGMVRVRQAFFGPELRFLAAPLDLPGAWAPAVLLAGGARF